MLGALVWWLKQLLPLTYWTVYGEGKDTRFCLWKMWLGRTYRVADFKVKQ